MGEYAVRWYRPGDEADMATLRADVWGAGTEAYIRWKYVETPFLDHVPVVVAETDGEIVGMRPFVPYRMREDGRETLALLHTDTIVHPDHRRQGLFTRMTERALDRYVDSDAAFTFGHSNANSRPGYRKLGWSDLGPRRWYTRVQDPYTSLTARRDDVAMRLAGRVTTPFVRGYLAVRERLLDVDGDVTVTRHEGLPVQTLATLYDSEQPDALHPVRDEAYYRWHAADPLEEHTVTHVAREDDRPLAAVCSKTVDLSFGQMTTIQGVEPMAGGRPWTRAIAALLDAVLAEQSTATYVKAWNPVFPDRLLQSFGFLPHDELPLSALTAPPDERLFVRPLAANEEAKAAARTRLRAASPYLWALG